LEEGPLLDMRVNSMTNIVPEGCNNSLSGWLHARHCFYGGMAQTWLTATGYCVSLCFFLVVIIIFQGKKLIENKGLN